jgi:hypothetical protein
MPGLKELLQWSAVKAQLAGLCLFGGIDSPTVKAVNEVKAATLPPPRALFITREIQEPRTRVEISKFLAVRGQGQT